MDKEQVLEKLKSINYPGFNRDIVSFGMIKNITILKSSIKLELNISSQNEDKKKQVIESIKEDQHAENLATLDNKSRKR